MLLGGKIYNTVVSIRKKENRVSGVFSKKEKMITNNYIIKKIRGKH